MIDADNRRSAFRCLADALINGTIRFALPVDAGPAYQRLVLALAAPEATQRDVAALLRHVVRFEAERGGADHPLRVPKEVLGAPWPSASLWREIGADVRDLGTHYSVLVRRWKPPWASEGETAVAAAFAEERRRAEGSAPGDPFLPVWTGFRDYSSPAQKQAVRAGLYCEPGDVLLVLLPTGSGKSLVALLPALITSEGGGTSIVVVPTVALALDQERALRDQSRAHGFADRLPSQLAYVGSMPHEEKTQFQSRIRDGTQRVLFVSPEALIGSFSRSVLESARSGLIRYFVVDEAHLVGQWGAVFRPEYQALEGFKRELDSVSPEGKAPRTVLMTATLTEDGLRVLQGVFSPDRPMQVVAGLQLRPEPQYVRVHCISDVERNRRLVEAVDQMPRPLIVYSTTRSSAEDYFALLRGVGYGRLALLHGGSSDSERARVVAAWDSSDLDIVVATAAFGVGVNNPHVRSVIHACMPENLDRYYQEVGRGGRDGLASVSLMLFTSSDIDVAFRINSRRLISVQRGLERWRRMFLARRTDHAGSTGGTAVVDVSIDEMPVGVVWDGVETRSWNLRTLNLMARAGIVRLGWLAPPERGGAEDDVDYRKRMDRYLATRRVEVLDSRHLDEALWRAKVTQVRDESARLAQAGSRQMVAVARATGQESVRIALSDLYDVDAAFLDGTTITYRPSIVAPNPEPVRYRGELRPRRLEAIASGCGLVGVFYEPNSIGYVDKVLRVLELSLEAGSLVVFNAGLVSDDDLVHVYESRKGWPFFVETLSQNDESAWQALSDIPQMPTIALLGPGFAGKAVPRALLSAHAHRILVLPHDARDPERQDLSVERALECVFDIDDFVRRLL